MNHESATGAARAVLTDIYAADGISHFKFEMSSHHPMNPDYPWEIVFSFVRPADAQSPGGERRTYVTVALDDAGQCVACYCSESFEGVVQRLYEHADTPALTHVLPGGRRVNIA